MARNNYSIGLTLIVVAVILVLGKLGFFHMIGAMLWPLFVLVPGLLLHFLFFGRVLPSGVLVPGGILVTYGLMFFFCNLFGWGSMTYLWPGFILGPAVGLYELHLFDRHGAKGALTASIILAVIAGVLFAFTFVFAVGVYFIAFAFLVIGAYLMMSRRPRSW